MDQLRESTRGVMGGRKGQAAIFITMTLTVSMGLLGLVIDIGWAYWRKEACATAANAAAFAAVSAASSLTNQSCGTTGSTNWTCSTYSCPSNPVNPSVNNLDNGCLYAKQNFFLNTGKQSVSLTGGTTSSPVSGVTPAYWVTATVTERIPTLFSAALGQPQTTVTAQSTSGMFKGSTGGCVYLLSPSASPAWSQSGGNFATGCGVYINSSASNAFSMVGGITSVTGGANINVHGNDSLGGGVLNFSGGGAMLTGQSSVTNPLAGLTGPTPAGTCLADPGIVGGIGITIPSGTYCSLSIGGGVGIVLSGTYIITTGNFHVYGGDISTAAGGTTIYFPPSNTTGYTNITGGNMTLTAPTSGSLSGIAIWDANTTVNSASISGGNAAINGIIYMPNSALTYSGSNTAVQQSIIAYTIAMSGGNISQPASSPYFSNGGTTAGNFIIQ